MECSNDLDVSPAHPFETIRESHAILGPCQPCGFMLFPFRRHPESLARRDIRLYRFGQNRIRVRTAVFSKPPAFANSGILTHVDVGEQDLLARARLSDNFAKRVG